MLETSSRFIHNYCSPVMILLMCRFNYLNCFHYTQIQYLQDTWMLSLLLKRYKSSCFIFLREIMVSPPEARVVINLPQVLSSMALLFPPSRYAFNCNLKQYYDCIVRHTHILFTVKGSGAQKHNETAMKYINIDSLPYTSMYIDSFFGPAMKAVISSSFWV